MKAGTSAVPAGILKDPALNSGSGAWMLAWCAGVPNNSLSGYAKGCICLDTTNGTVYRNSGTAASSTWTDISTAGAANAFKTINAPAGTDPVADSATDTLNLTSTGSTITITGNSTTDTLNFEIATGCITNAMVNAAAAIAWSKMAAMTAGYIIVGSAGTVPTAVQVTGDVAMSNAGVTTVTDLTISSEAQGDILYFNGSNWVRLAAGSAGQGLVTAGAGSNPYWGSPAVATASSLANSVTCEAGANDYTIAFGTAGGAYTLTVPAVGGSRTFAFINEAQTFSANQTLGQTNLWLQGGDANAMNIKVNETLTGAKTLNIKINDTDRTIDLSGNITTANNFVTSGNFSLTLTQTGATNVTLPTTGTLATLAGSEALTNKTYEGLTITTSASGVLTIAASKTFTVNNTITLAGTDSQVYTFPASTDTVACLGTAQEFSAAQTFANTMFHLLDSGGTHDLIVISTGTGMAADRTLTLDCNNASATFSFNGNITFAGAMSFAGAWTHTGAHAVSITTQNTADFTFADGTAAALTFPTGTDTLVGRASTDTFTNKSFDCDGTGNALTNVNATELDPVTVAANVYGVPFMLHVINTGAADITITVPYKCRIIDMVMRDTKAGNAGTWQLRTATGGAGNAITAAVAYATADNGLSRVATIDNAEDAVAAGSIYLRNTNGADTADGWILCVRED